MAKELFKGYNEYVAIMGKEITLRVNAADAEYNRINLTEPFNEELLDAKWVELKRLYRILDMHQHLRLLQWEVTYGWEISEFKMFRAIKIFNALVEFLGIDIWKGSNSADIPEWNSFVKEFNEVFTTK